MRSIPRLSTITGIHQETVRYLIKKRFRELGLSLGFHIDYARLGLQRVFGVLEFSDAMYMDAPRLLEILSKYAFLTYHCSELHRPRHVVTFGVPISLKAAFESFLDRLVTEKILSSFVLKNLDWTRHLSLNTRYYNFKTREWSIDWSSVAKSEEPPPAPPFLLDPVAKPSVDSIDISLIKELQIDSGRSISKIAAKLKVNERTARWHHSNHVAPLTGSRFVQLSASGSWSLTSLVGVILEFVALTSDQTNMVRMIFNNFPFTWNENGGDRGYYLSFVLVPVEHYVKSMQFLTTSLRKYVTKWETYPLDLTTSQSYTIPNLNFSRELGWFMRGEEEILDLLQAVMVQKRGV